MNRPEPSEHSLVGRASSGDLDAVEALLARHLPGLERFVRRRGAGLPRQKESATDLVQSVCREVLEGLNGDRFEYRGEAEFKAWLYEAAHLKILGRRRYWGAERRDPGREARVDPSAGEAPLPGGGATPSREAQEEEERGQLRALLAELPENYRRAIELAHVEGRPHREVAAELGITEAASRMLLSRALARLGTLAERGEREGHGPR